MEGGWCVWCLWIAPSSSPCPSPPLSFLSPSPLPPSSPPLQSISSTLARAKCYHTMDAFVKLVVVLVRFSGDSTNHVIKVNLLNKVLVTVAAVLLQDQEARGTEFHQLPYHRFFVMLLNDLSSPDVVFDAISFHVMQAFW